MQLLFYNIKQEQTLQGKLKTWGKEKLHSPKWILKCYLCWIFSINIQEVDGISL